MSVQQVIERLVANRVAQVDAFKDTTEKHFVWLEELATAFKETNNTPNKSAETSTKSLHLPKTPSANKRRPKRQAAKQAASTIKKATRGAKIPLRDIKQQPKNDDAVSKTAKKSGHSKKVTMQVDTTDENKNPPRRTTRASIRLSTAVTAAELTATPPPHEQETPVTPDTVMRADTPDTVMQAEPTRESSSNVVDAQKTPAARFAVAKEMARARATAASGAPPPLPSLGSSTNLLAKGAPKLSSLPAKASSTTAKSSEAAKSQHPRDITQTTEPAKTVSVAMVKDSKHTATAGNAQKKVLPLPRRATRASIRVSPSAAVFAKSNAPDADDDDEQRFYTPDIENADNAASETPATAVRATPVTAVRAPAAAVTAPTFAVPKTIVKGPAPVAPGSVTKAVSTLEKLDTAAFNTPTQACKSSKKSEGKKRKLFRKGTLDTQTEPLTATRVKKLLTPESKTPMSTLPVPRMRTVTKSAAAASKTSGHTQASPATAESMDDPTGEEADVDEPKTDNYVGIKRQVLAITRQLRRRKPSRAHATSMRRTTRPTAGTAGKHTRTTKRASIASSVGGSTVREFVQTLEKQSTQDRLQHLPAPAIDSGTTQTTEPSTDTAFGTTSGGGGGKILTAMRSMVPTKDAAKKAPKKRVIAVAALKKAEQSRLLAEQKQAERQRKKEELRANFYAQKDKKQDETSDAADAVTTKQQALADRKKAREEAAAASEKQDNERKRKAEEEHAAQDEAAKRQRQELADKRKQQEERARQRRDELLRKEQEVATAMKAREKEHAEAQKRFAAKLALQKERREQKLLEDKAKAQKTQEEAVAAKLRAKREAEAKSRAEQAAKNTKAAAASSSASSSSGTTTPKATEANYDMSDLLSDASTDDEDNPRNEVPNWAQGPALRNALYNQFVFTPDEKQVKALFPSPPSPVLEQIFPKKSRPFRPRTSSAMWEPSPNRTNLRKLL